MKKDTIYSDNKNLLLQELIEIDTEDRDSETFKASCLLILSEQAKKMKISITSNFSDLDIDAEEFFPFLKRCEEIWNTTQAEVQELLVCYSTLLKYGDANNKKEDADFREISPNIEMVLSNTCYDIEKLCHLTLSKIQ